MASQTYTTASILVGGIEINANTGTFAMEGQLATRPATTFGSNGHEEVRPGLLSARATIDGFTDFASGGVASYFGAYPASNYAMTASIPGSSAGDPAWLMKVRPSNLTTVGGSVGEMAPFAMQAMADSPFGRGKLLAPVATVSANGDGTAVTLAGPTASQYLYVALHVTATSGGGTWTVKVQSDDNSGFTTATDRVTFSTFTGQTWEWSSVAGSFSSETHLRATWSVSGGSTPTATFAVACFVG